VDVRSAAEPIPYPVNWSTRAQFRRRGQLRLYAAPANDIVHLRGTSCELRTVVH